MPQYSKLKSFAVKAFILLSISALLSYGTAAADYTNSDLGSIIAQTPFYSKQCLGAGSSPTPSPTPTTVSSGSSVYILGDSITVRAESAYQAAFNKNGIQVNIDAQSGRGLVDPGTASENPNIPPSSLTSGLQAITADSSNIASAGAIVIALGTNPGDSASTINQAIQSIRSENSKAPIYWVDTIDVGRTFSSWLAWDQQVIGPTNQAIYSQAGQDNYQVISWFKAVDPNGDPQNPAGNETDTSSYIDNSDGYGFHPSVAGENALSTLVSSTLTSGQGTTSSSTSSASCACAQGGSTVGGYTSTTGDAAWNSTIQPPYYLEEFAINVLEDLAQTTSTPEASAVTQQHVLALIGWFWAEGGDIENSDLFNPLNSSQIVPGAVIQSTGNEAYPSFNSGVQALVLNMTDSDQNRVGKALTDPSTNANQVMQAVTYYQQYPGDKAWATADIADQTGYYNALISDVNQATTSYDKEAATEIGTPGYEENENLRVPGSQLVYSNASGSSSPGSSSSATAAGSCSSSPTSSGTYQNPLRSISNLVPERIDQGVDYSGTGPVYAIGDGTVVNIAGAGWPNSVFISYVLTDGPAEGKTVYFAECVTPSVTVGQSVTASTVIGTMINCGSGIETGWAESSGDLAAASGIYQEGAVTAYGVNFSQLLQSIGAPPGVMDKPTITGTLPAGWPTWQ